MWRPDNWQEFIGGKYGAFNRSEGEIFENGADAMLESLKNMSLTYINEFREVVPLSISRETSISNGYLVFIPNDTPDRGN